MGAATTRLVLVRHGEVDANQKLHYLGRRDDPLNERGLEQARALASALDDVPFDVVVSSPLRRALTTAEVIARAAGVEVTVEPRLVELDFGAWEGRSRSEVMAAGEPERRAVRSWEADPSRPTPGGESLVEVRGRVLDLADELSRDRRSKTVVMVSHMGPIKVVLTAALGLPLAAASRIFLDPGTISVVDWGSRPVVRLVNSHVHLGFGNARWLRSS